MSPRSASPLVSFREALYFRRTTKTDTGVCVQAWLVRKRCETGETISQADMGALPLCGHQTLLDWNYTLCPWPSSKM